MSAPGSLIAALNELRVTTVNPDDLPNSPSRAAHYLATTGPDAVLFGSDLPTETVFAIASELETAYPEIDVVAIAEPTQQRLSDAMHHGVRKLIDPDAGNEIIGRTVSGVAAGAGLRRTRLAGSGGAPRAHGRLIAVMAAKGGVGKTTIAVNLAVVLARSAPNEVVLVDLDLLAGDADLMLGIEAASTVAAVATPGTILDEAVLKLSLTPHPTGLLVLPAPDDLVEADGVDCDRVVDMLKMLRRMFAYVVVDTAPGAGSELAAAVEVADDLLAVATPDVGGLRSLRRNLDGLETLGLVRARRHLIVNRSDRPAGMEPRIERTVELAVDHAIVESLEIASASNQGRPFVEAYPRNEAGGAFTELAAALGADCDEPARPTRRLGAA